MASENIKMEKSPTKAAKHFKNLKFDANLKRNTMQCS